MIRTDHYSSNVTLVSSHMWTMPYKTTGTTLSLDRWAGKDWRNKVYYLKVTTAGTMNVQVERPQPRDWRQQTSLAFSESVTATIEQYRAPSTCAPRRKRHD
ncbi:hypothetical protein SERLA73DRAFT_143548 [Serpula lacrymans var. lacrymans S7.3]|uniref:Uncharacterized protein n=2 Tax=Serpula lacrymans var. lacrymans TaxID=341189 RepID=F8QAA4_SERL3|nr:uncharacterized protein SERLADRAFT_400293 [Serpula lacrymans var. lacrymans S7.9]EGN94694.1 hypothetical protein SERLA73DRAFT_143548 [Serpula lacrymans var. lacrymans S7.3]EGO20172.1 hypothetical protein SERLADRAFT_400293 [Serpula lacrymans var. lacrymans S7.9]